MILLNLTSRFLGLEPWTSLFLLNFWMNQHHGLGSGVGECDQIFLGEKPWEKWGKASDNWWITYIFVCNIPPKCYVMVKGTGKRMFFLRQTAWPSLVGNVNFGFATPWAVELGLNLKQPEITQMVSGRIPIQMHPNGCLGEATMALVCSSCLGMFGVPGWQLFPEIFHGWSP